MTCLKIIHNRQLWQSERDQLPSQMMQKRSAFEKMDKIIILIPM